MATPPASYGYPKAAIAADKLPIWQQPLARFTVAGARDWKVSSLVSIDRGIRVEAGMGSGDAVTDVTFEYETMSLPSPNIASRWYLIVRRRNWSGVGTSTLVAVPGSATKALPIRKDTPGAESDQPLALVRVTQKDTTVQEIVDLRCWASNGGVEVADKLALSYLGTPGSALKLDGTLWNYELQSNGVWDWKERPLAKPMEHAEFVFSFRSRTGALHGIDGGVVFDSARSINGGFASLPNGFLDVSTEGTYMVSLHVEWGGPANDSCYLAILHPDGETMASTSASTGAGATTVGGTGFYLKPGTKYPGNRLALRVVQHMGADRNVKGRVRITKIA